MSEVSRFHDIPSIDAVIRTETLAPAIDRFGRSSVVSSARHVIESLRRALSEGVVGQLTLADIAEKVLERVEVDAAPRVRPVFNLTGTILHTNLGRAAMSDAAVAAATLALRGPIALEFDLATGRRGERESLVHDCLCELTGAESATVVNNNAAAVMLILNTLANRRETIVSRGELIEIGGAFRLPELMARAGTRLVEVGTTNRTHSLDYSSAISSKSALIMKVHTSNYRIEGFTADVSARSLAEIARRAGIPLVHDLGSGVLVDLSPYGIPKEATVAEAIADGAGLVTFSGDKLLGGPQAGIVVGRRDLIGRLIRNPLKRALRIDKVRLAALEATLRLYRDPDRLPDCLPTLRHIARRPADIRCVADRVLPILSGALGPSFRCEVADFDSEIGSGALPVQTLRSAGIAIRFDEARGSGGALKLLAAALRGLPVPVIGRISRRTLILDLRCLDDERGFAANIAKLQIGQHGPGSPIREEAHASSGSEATR